MFGKLFKGRSLWITVWMLVFTVLLTVNGCSAQKDNTPAKGDTVAKQEVTGEKKEAPKAKVTLDYWIAGDPIRTKVYQKSIEEFEKVNPNIKVTVNEEVGNNTQIQQKLVTMVAAGTSPDVIHVDTMYVEDMAKAGTIMEFNGFPGSKELADAIFPGAQEPLIINGKIYAYPIRANSIQLVYNKKMFREAGLDPEKPPKTFDQVIDYAVKLTKRDSKGNVEVYGYETGLTKDPHWTAHVFSPILWSYGGSYLSADGKAGFNSEAGIKTIKYWNRLINELKVSPTERIDKGLETGKVAMIHTGEWSIKPYRQDFPGLEYGFATLPVAAEGVKPAIPLGGRANVIPKQSRYPNEAWKVVQWVMNKEEQMRYTSEEVGLTPRKDLLDNPWFKDHKEYKQALEDMTYVKAKSAPEILQMNTLLGDAIQRALLMGEDPQKALKEAADKYNAVLAKIK